jgi:hypothetical protein
VRERSVGYKSLLDCKIFSWVRRSTLQLGAGRGEKDRRREDLLAQSADKNCMLYINII